jgi:hypothetical protein
LIKVTQDAKDKLEGIMKEELDELEKDLLLSRETEDLTNELAGLM